MRKSKRGKHKFLEDIGTHVLRRTKNPPPPKEIVDAMIKWAQESAPPAPERLEDMVPGVAYRINPPKK